MSDLPFYSPQRRPAAPRQAQPGEPLFTCRTPDDRPVACELRGHGEWGWEAQFFVDGSFSRSRTFPTRDAAIAWAQAERRDVERGYTDDQR